MQTQGKYREISAHSMKVSNEILTLVPYKPGKPIAEVQREFQLKEVLKLASNENPLGPSPKALQAIQLSLKDIHRYPDPSFYDLIQALSQRWDLPVSLLSVGNGSNEVIDLLIRIFCEPGEAILTTQAAFVAYQVCAQAARVKTFFTPLAEGYKTDLQAMARFLKIHPEASRVKLVFLPNPNNPTGTILDSSEVEWFLNEFRDRSDLLFVFDEAYHDYVRDASYKTLLSHVSDESNVIVLRTFSKIYGLAALRVGVLVAPTFVVELFNRVRNSFNVNQVAQVAALAALEDFEFIKRSLEMTWSGLDYLYEEFKKLKLPFIPSQGNFVLFDTKEDASQVYLFLLKQGVILRPVINYGFSTHLRMTVGTEEENRKTLWALAQALLSIKKENYERAAQENKVYIQVSNADPLTNKNSK